MTSTYPKLYKIDSNGNTRVWWIEYDEEKYCTHSGIEGGQIVMSGWKYPEAKNVGRSNETTVEEQVIAEIEAEYKKKQNQGKYHANIEDTESGAKFHECMLANKYVPAKHKDFPYISQPKYDGIRCLISKDGMQSRQGKPIVSAPHIFEALQDFFEIFPDVVLDGELYNHDLKNDFEKIVSLVRKTKPTMQDFIESSIVVQFHVYDIVGPGSYEDRYEFLMDAIGDSYVPMIHVAKCFTVNNPNDIQKMLGFYLECGYEGQMLRDPAGLYEGKRSNGLLKHKEFEDAEYPIVKITEGQGNWAGYAKSVEIMLPDGTTQNAGMRGTQEYLKDVLDHASEYNQATVRYQNTTADGKLRFPVVVTLWKGNRDL